MRGTGLGAPQRHEPLAGHTTCLGLVVGRLVVGPVPRVREPVTRSSFGGDSLLALCGFKPSRGGLGPPQREDQGAHHLGWASRVVGGAVIEWRPGAH